MHPEFAPVALISACSLLIPLPWHWKAGNVATLAIIFWLFLSNIIYAVDALVWAKNVDVVLIIWCDITTKLLVGANFALPAACLCICIHLEQVASLRSARTSIADKRRRQLFEAIICFSLPILFMALHYIVQGHRFDIIEDYGCRPATYFSIPSIFIIWIPPLVMAVASLIFAGLALRHFFLRRIAFASHLASHSALTTSRYLRLMAMAALQMVWSLTATSYTLWFTAMSLPIRPYTNWADVHSNFSRIDVFLTAFTPARILKSFYVLWWMIPASTFIFVAFFAFGHDAVEEYKQCFSWLCNHIPPWHRTSNKQHRTLGFDKLSVRRNEKSTNISSSAPSESSTTLSPLAYKPLLHSAGGPYCSSHMSSHDRRSETPSAECPSIPVNDGKSTRSESFSDSCSISDLSVIPPIVSHRIPDTPLLPPSPLTPPPLHPRLAHASPVSPRPLTYPSFDHHQCIAHSS